MKILPLYYYINTHNICVCICIYFIYIHEYLFIYLYILKALPYKKFAKQSSIFLSWTVSFSMKILSVPQLHHFCSSNIIHISQIQQQIMPQFPSENPEMLQWHILLPDSRYVLQNLWVHIKRWMQVECQINSCKFVFEFTDM